LDVGDKRIGMALSDPSLFLASPLEFIRRKQLKLDVDRILKVVDEWDVKKIVVGLPLSMNGEVSAQTTRVQLFLEILRESSPVRVEDWDERLSTWEAEHMLREAGRKPSRDRGRSDSAAAAVILQRYLDKMRSKC